MRAAKRRFAAMGAALSMALLALVSGCTAGSTSTAALPTFTKNQSEWVMPGDGYRFSDMDLESYATDVQESKCLARKGYTQWQSSLFPMQVNGPRPVTENGVGWKLFDVQLASQYGYRSAPDARWDADRAATFGHSMEYATGAESDAVAECAKSVATSFDAVRRKYPRLPANTYSEENDPALKNPIERWRSCMAPLGIPDLPEQGPVGMPSPSMSKSFGMDTTDSGKGNGRLTAYEIKIATADARCRDSSGYATTAYHDQWNADLKVLQKQQSDLPRIKQGVAAYKAAMIKAASGA